MRPAVFLDRDGVISKSIIIDGKAYAPRSLKDFELFPNVVKAIKLLKKSSFLVFVVTNQPDVGNKLMLKSDLDKMHEKLRKKINIDGIMACTHNQIANCSCRKPKPGMIFKIAKKYKINLKNSFLVGDRASDIKAGKRAKCKTIFIDRNYKETKPTNQDATFLSLMDAASYIISENFFFNKNAKY